MENLKENSIHIEGSIVVCWPQHNNKETILDMTDIGSKFDYSYCVNNSTICFVHNHEVYVTPYTEASVLKLQEAGFWEKYFYVPFSNCDYPKYQRDRWFYLKDATLLTDEFIR